MKPSKLAFALSLFCPAVAEAQSLENAILRNSFAPVGAGARAAGMGGAFLAIADDGTAASFNPAGLAQLRKPELALVAYDDRLRSRVDLSGGAYPVESESARHSVPQFFGFAKPLQAGSRRLTLQLSYERTVDFVGRGRAAALLDVGDVPGIGPAAVLVDMQSEQEGAMHTVTAAVGLALTDELMLGASASYWIGEWNASGVEDSHILLGNPPQSFSIDSVEFRQDHSFRGLNLNVGSLFRKSWFSVGGVLRLPFSGRYAVAERNSTTVATESGPALEPVASEQGMRTILHWPLSAGIGIAVRPVKGLTLAADTSWTHWETMIIENVPNGGLLTEPVTDDQNQPVPMLFHDRNFFDLYPASQSITGGTGQWRVGVEYLLNLSHFVVPLRVGHAWEESPVPDLERLDSRRIQTTTLGIGLSFRRVALDVAYERRTSSGGLGVVLGRPQTFGIQFPTEDVTQERIVSSLVVRF